MRRTLFATAIVLLAATSAVRADIMSTLKSNPELSTLANAIESGGLSKSLESQGPFTVFAPNNDAFDKLPKAALESLFKPANAEALLGLLTYHVIAERLPSGSLNGKKSELESVEGSILSVDGTAGIKIGEASIVSADIAASNGIVHIIDTVLAPE